MSTFLGIVFVAFVIGCLINACSPKKPAYRIDSTTTVKKVR